MKPLPVLITLLLAGCVAEPEERVRVIDCGDLNLEDQPPAYTVTDSTCRRTTP